MCNIDLWGLYIEQARYLYSALIAGRIEGGKTLANGANILFLLAQHVRMGRVYAISVGMEGNTAFCLGGSKQ